MHVKVVLTFDLAISVFGVMTFSAVSLIVEHLNAKIMNILKFVTTNQLISVIVGVALVWRTVS